MMLGSQPTTAQATTLASGLRSFSVSADSLATSIDPAPSQIPELLSSLYAILRACMPWRNAREYEWLQLCAEHFNYNCPHDVQQSV
eukprot:2460-Heterococcus_DN1.PRE.1